MVVLLVVRSSDRSPLKVKPTKAARGLSPVFALLLCLLFHEARAGNDENVERGGLPSRESMP